MHMLTQSALCQGDVRLRLVSSDTLERVTVDAIRKFEISVTRYAGQDVSHLVKHGFLRDRIQYGDVTH